MKKDDPRPEAPNDLEQPQPAPDTPWLSERLTETEIKALRQDQNETLDFLQKAYPNLKVHRAVDDSPEEPNDKG